MTITIIVVHEPNDGVIQWTIDKNVRIIVNDVRRFLFGYKLHVRRRRVVIFGTIRADSKVLQRPLVHQLYERFIVDPPIIVKLPFKELERCPSILPECNVGRQWNLVALVVQHGSGLAAVHRNGNLMDGARNRRKRRQCQAQWMDASDNLHV